jgi:6-phosphogluconolactonase
LPVLNNAALLIFLITGKKKAAIARELLSEEAAAAYPAGLLRPHNGRLIWLLDEDAASDIDDDHY